MRSALDAVRGRSDQTAIERAFDLWRLRSLGAQLARVNDVRSLRPFWTRWKRKAARTTALEVTLAGHVEAQERRVMASTLFAWLRAAALRAGERQLEVRSDQLVLNRAWTVWTDRACVAHCLEVMLKPQRTRSTRR